MIAVRGDDDYSRVPDTWGEVTEGELFRGPTWGGGSEESPLWLGTGEGIRAGKAALDPPVTSSLPPPLEPRQATQSPGTCHVLSHLQALAPGVPPAVNALSLTSRPLSRLSTNITTWQPPASLGPGPCSASLLVNPSVLWFSSDASPPPSTVGSPIVRVKLGFCLEKSVSAD